MTALALAVVLAVYVVVVAARDVRRAHRLGVLRQPTINGHRRNQKVAR